MPGWRASTLIAIKQQPGSAVVAIDDIPFENCAKRSWNTLPSYIAHARRYLWPKAISSELAGPPAAIDFRIIQTTTSLDTDQPGDIPSKYLTMSACCRYRCISLFFAMRI
jgi:hypothetical protein